MRAIDVRHQDLEHVICAWHVDDVIVVRVWATETRRASIRFEYAIVNERTGRTTTTGHTWHVVMGKERKAVSIPPEVRAMFEAEPKSA